MSKKYTPHVVTWLKRRGQRATRLVVEDGKPVLLFEPDPAAHPKPRRISHNQNTIVTRNGQGGPV